MTITIRFRMAYGRSSLTKRPDVDAWCIWRDVLESATGITVSSDAIAIFNIDSEANTFIRFLIDRDIHTALEVPDDSKELYALQIKNRDGRRS